MAFLILSLLIITSLVAGHRALSGSSDFDVYYYAGKAVSERAPLYTIAGHSVNSSGSPFVYPPFFAFLMAPLAALPIYQAAILWNIISLCSFLGALFLIIQIIGFEKDLKTRLHEKNIVWLFLFAALVITVLIDNLAMAQVNCFVFFLVMLGVFYLRKSRDFLSGFWIGIAACVKLFPAIFFPYYVIERKWKALLGALAALILCAAIVPAAFTGVSRSMELHQQWFQETLKAQATPKTLAFYSTQLNPSHQDLRAAVFRWVIDWEFRERTGGPNGREFIFRTPLRLSEEQAGYAANAAIGIAVLILFIILIKTSRKPGKNIFLYSISLILTTMVLVSPKARSHFFVFLVFPWSVLIEQMIACGKNKRREKQVFLISAFFYFAQGVKYLKFLGFGALSVLTLWIYFVVKLAKPAKEDA